MEEEISSLYKVIDDANLAKMDLEALIESMKEELSNLARNHEEVNGHFFCNSPYNLLPFTLLHLCGPPSSETIYKMQRK